jgi:outer membrane protein TolC
LDWLIGSLPKSSFGMIILFLAMLPMVPVITLEIPDISGRDLPRGLAEDVNTYINRALSRRPDILATLAKLRTTEAEIDVARATYYPTLGLEGYVNQNVGSLSVNHGPNYRVDEPAAGILFKLSLPLYDGSIRENVLNIARSRNEAAKEELSKIQDEAVRQIARSYDAVKSALAEYNAALALVEASDTAYVAVLDSYRNGLGTLINAGTAGTETTHAQSIQSQAYALVPTAAAALAFSTGELTKADVLNHPP